LRNSSRPRNATETPSMSPTRRSRHASSKVTPLMLS
jgi:hypothetical protein